MSRRVTIANLVGLAACVPVAWAIHRLLLGERFCGRPGEPACADDSVMLTLALGGGMAVAIIAAVAGGRWAFTGLFLAVAGGSLWAATMTPSDERLLPLLLAGTFGLVGLLPLILLPWLLLRRRRAARLVTEGATAIGTVTAVRDTGMLVNHNPRVEITLQIAPEDGSPAFEGSKTAVVSKIDLPYVGRRYPVWYDRDDPKVFALGTKVESDAAPEVRRLFARAAADTARATPPTADAPAEPSSAQPSAADPFDRLAKLQSLRQTGALTEAEFETQKAKLLEQA